MKKLTSRLTNASGFARFAGFVGSLGVVGVSVATGLSACGGSDGGAPGGDGGGADATNDSGTSGGDSGADGGGGGGDGGSPGDGGGSSDGGTAMDGASVLPPPGSCSSWTYTKQAFFGDLHTHTILSADAWAFGTLNEPADAYQFARGATKNIAEGSRGGTAETSTIDRPLDFDAVTDHSEWIAVTLGCVTDAAGKPLDPSNPFGDSCKAFTALQGTGPGAIVGADAVLTKNCGSAMEEQDAGCSAVTQSAWKMEQAAANAANVACEFTAFNAYEWTAMDADNNTLHKNVIFATDQVPALPYDFLDYPEATDLWTALDQGCLADAGCTATTIPHNSNLSGGNAFTLPTTTSGIDQMVRYQKLVEIYQHKGASECPPDAGLADGGIDTACGFEAVDVKDAGSNPQSYVRTALGNGIAATADGGPNPLQLGIVGATDDHNGLPGNVREDTWPGHLGSTDDSPKARLSTDPDFGPGAITGVWAEENTRASIYAALQRRETFATSGPRMQIRFYETWSDTDFCNGGFPSNIIDAGGVPMGGTMTATAPSSGGGATAPWFYVEVANDTLAVLQRDGTSAVTPLGEIDILKGTTDASGSVQTSLTTAAPTSANTSCTRWQDPSFDPKKPAYYYARVLQAPSPRWSHFDCLAAPDTAGCAAGPASLDRDVQERAWSSPIWSMP